MIIDIDSRATSVKKQIEEYFVRFDENFFDEFATDNRTKDFIEYYEKTVLDKERIKFGEFKMQWAIQGMTKEVFSYFDENFDKLKEEIEREKDIERFFEKYCCAKRREASFCSKLFHTILPSEFPPVDNPIKNGFGLRKEEFITSVLIIKKSYEMFIKENPDKINSIRKILSKDKFSYLKVQDLSDMRIIDMCYWFDKNRKRNNRLMRGSSK